MQCEGGASHRTYTVAMDRLWTPWRYNYITGGQPRRDDGKPPRKGVPAALDGWPGPDADCVFCNLIRAVEWGIDNGWGEEGAERAGLVLRRTPDLFLCLNAFPYTSGHLMVVPRVHTDSLAKLTREGAANVAFATQAAERALREVYRPDGINLGMNLGEAAGAGVAAHLHLHALPRWFGDTNFMTVVGETRILPEDLEVTWARLREALPQAGDLL